MSRLEFQKTSQQFLKLCSDLPKYQGQLTKVGERHSNHPSTLQTKCSMWDFRDAGAYPSSEPDTNMSLDPSSLLILEQHSNQPIRLEGQVYSFCQV